MTWGASEYRCYSKQMRLEDGAPYKYLRGVKLYERRGRWGFLTLGGWMWRREFGYKSRLSALRAASRWLEGYKLLPKDGAA